MANSRHQTHRYTLDDPQLDVVLRRMAEETAANWPPVSEGQRARLAPLLAASPTPTPTPSAPEKRAA